MRRPNLLPAFSKQEYIKAHAFLASKVATMMGRKFEEGDWADVYCASKGIPNKGWSNLNIDIMHNGLGVEQKMLCAQSGKSIKDYCGTTQMHPSATRSIRVESTDGDPTLVARDVLQQYAELIEQRRQKVFDDYPSVEPDMRTGWLLWQERLEEFLYFEEEMLPPNPNDYWAEWKESGGGSRKVSKNLWVYENETGRKRYSITTAAGAKIQPYFDIPAPNATHLYHFRVQGEEIENGFTRIWITSTTALLLEELFGTFETDTVSSAIIESAKEYSIVREANKESAQIEVELARPIIITRYAYLALKHSFPGINDDHMVQLFARYNFEGRKQQ